MKNITLYKVGADENGGVRFATANSGVMGENLQALVEGGWKFTEREALLSQMYQTQLQVKVFEKQLEELPGTIALGKKYISNLEALAMPKMVRILQELEMGDAAVAR